MSYYLEHYILSYFKQNEAVNASQIYHVFQGKRTPSMLYIAEKNQWHHGFANFVRVPRKKIDASINKFNQLSWLEPKDKGYVLTESGRNRVKVYFDEHYFPSEIKTFSHLNLRTPFWDRYQLLTQVFSESSYNNKQYIPVIKDPLHQEQVRLIFHYFKDNTENLSKKWIEEQYVMFDLLEEKRVNQLFLRLSGHEVIGATKSQVQEILLMDSIEYNFYHLDTIEQMIHSIKQNPENLSLLNAVVESLQNETQLGLSSSTYQTYLWIKDGRSISEIAKERNLKENTIREHILEIAFILDDFPYEMFVSKTLTKELNEQFLNDDDYSFKKALADFEAIQFMEYRLIELERLRNR